MRVPTEQVIREIYEVPFHHVLAVITTSMCKQCWLRSQATFMIKEGQVPKAGTSNAFQNAIDNCNAELAGPHSRRPCTSTSYKTIDL